MVSKIWIMLR